MLTFHHLVKKLTFSGLFHLEVKKHTLGKIVKNHRNEENANGKGDSHPHHDGVVDLTTASAS